MPYTFDDYDTVWCNNIYPVKIWATSKVSFNRYYDSAKERFSLLLETDMPDLIIPELDHVEIVRDEVRYIFKETVIKNKRVTGGQLVINGNLVYNYWGNKIHAQYLSRKE